MCVVKEDYVQQALLSWYDNNKRDLPWRRTKDPYKIWVSEIMLQQTRVDTVIPYYLRFIEKFPTIEDLANASTDEVLTQWQGLGYYSRGRNLQKGAVYIVNEFEGRMPETIQEIKKIPGIGDYTGGAILSIAMNKPEVAIDGNVKRVISRIYGITEDLETKIGKEKIRNCAWKLLPVDRASDMNQAYMDLGSKICSPNKPNCDACPIHKQCSGYQQGIQAELPTISKKIKVKDIQRIVLIISYQGAYYLTKRPLNGLFGGMWEFPGFDAKNREISDDQIREYLEKTFGIEARHVHLVIEGKHIFTHMKWHMQFFLCELDNRHGQEDEDRGWFALEELYKLAIPSAYKHIFTWIEAQ